MSKLAKLVNLSLAVAQGSAISHLENNSKKSRAYFKEMHKQLGASEKNNQIQKAIDVLKRFRKKYKTTKSRSKTKRSKRSI